MVIDLLRLNIAVTDEQFDDLFPAAVQALAQKHWTPVAVAKIVSEFLVDRPGTRVLDIGSGPGKFCMVGAVHTRGHFTGIEQRLDFVELAKWLSVRHNIPNVAYFHVNMTSVNFRRYDAFYFYNSFYENIAPPHDRIGSDLPVNAELYGIYSMYLTEQLALLPPGTRLATYSTPTNVIPRKFRLVDELCEGYLKLWEKES